MSFAPFSFSHVFLRQAFFLLLSCAVVAAVYLYARHFNVAASYRVQAKHAKSEIERLQWEANPDLEKGWLMLSRQHEASINLLKVMGTDDQISALTAFWYKMPETERSMRFEKARNALITEPGMAPLLKSQGRELTDTLVPEMFAEETFASDPSHLMKLLNLLLDGQENTQKTSEDPGVRKGRHDARDMYRSAILSRFVASFLLDLSVALAAVEPRPGMEKAILREQGHIDTVSAEI